RRQDHLAAAARTAGFAILPPAHAAGAAAVEHDALGEAAGLDAQVLPVQHRPQEAARRRPAPAQPLVDVEVADAFVVAGVEVAGRRNAVLDRRIAEGIEDLPRQPRRLHPPFAARPVVLAV